MEDNKKKALEQSILNIKKKYGQGAIIKMNEKASNIDAVSTGSLGLDIALGIGGIPKGRIIEIYGPESSGKTTLSLEIVAQFQKQGGSCAYIDAEHALDIEYAKNLGVNIDEIYLSQPDNGEQALDIAENLASSGAIDLIVVDSVAALVPKAEIEGDMGDSHMGLQARLMSQALRKITGVVSKTNCTVIFINQLRQKIGVMFGNPEVTTGGTALKFYASVRLDIRKIESIKVGGEVVANRVRVKIIKNKVAPPFKETEFVITFGKGIDSAMEIVDVAEKCNIISKSGAWYSYNEHKIGQGSEKAKLYLLENPAVMEEIKEKIFKLYFANEEDSETQEES